MPYINQEQRNKYVFIEKAIQLTHEIENKGSLEYLVFMLMKKYMSTREKRYSNLHDVVYAVMHCADEYRRRFLDKREDDALKTNGDI